MIQSDTFFAVICCVVHEVTWDLKATSEHIMSRTDFANNLYHSYHLHYSTKFWHTDTHEMQSYSLSIHEKASQKFICM